MDDIIRIIKSLANSSVLNDGVTKTVKHEIKKGNWISSSLLAPMVPLLIASAAFSLVKGVFQRGVTRSAKEVTRAERGSNNMCHMDKNV